VFLALLAVHVAASLTAVITGAAAALAPKGGPRQCLHWGDRYALTELPARSDSAQSI
jgi:hypothetical protein